MALRLTPISSGVAHSSAHRTRLKVPKDLNIASNSLMVKDAIERVPGVKDVRVVPPIGSVIVEHDDRPDVLENIGEAIAKVSPDLFNLFTAEVAGPNTALLSLFSNLFREDENVADAEADAGGTSAAPSIKRVIPYAFLAAGLMQVLEGEALLAGVGPLALFYWAFDSRWKFKQEKLAQTTLQLEKAQELQAHELKK